MSSISYKLISDRPAVAIKSFLIAYCCSFKSCDC